MKVGSINVCLLSCQFYYTYETCKHCALWQRKKLCISILISLLNLMRNISKLHFSGGRVILNSVMDIHYSTEKGGADQNRMTVDVREWAFKTFYFVEIINEWSLNRRIIETHVSTWSFGFEHCMYQNHLRLVIYRF